MIVIDASALVATIGNDPDAATANVRLRGSGETLHAPHLIDIEVTHALQRGARAGIYPPDLCRAVLASLIDLPLERYRHAPLHPRVWALRHKLSAYDAIYVALAELLDAPLLTRDRRLAAAPGHSARIELV